MFNIHWPTGKLLGRYLLLSVSLALVLSGVSRILGGNLSLVAKTLLLNVVLIFIPVIAATFGKGRFTQAIITPFGVTIAITGYYGWVLNSYVPGLWVVWVLILMFILFIGVYILSLQQVHLTNRLIKLELCPKALDEVRRLFNVYRQHGYFYYSAPLGSAIAIGCGWSLKLSDASILTLEAITALVVAALILLIMLLASALRISETLLLFSPTESKPVVVAEKGTSFLGKFVKALQIRLSPTPNSETQDFTHSLDMAYVVSDLRKFYFYDSVHNCTLLVGFLASLVSIFNINIVLENLLAAAGVAVLSPFLFCYLPFAIGQSRLHEAILDIHCLEGIARKELKAKLTKTSPLYPKSDFFSALVATGTIGGLIAAIIYEVLKNALK